MKIAIIGGGASGLIASIAAKNKGAEVYIIEKNNTLGKKLLVTGNGKCNLTNINLSEDMYFSSDRSFIMSSIRKFNYLRTLSFFEGLGVLLKEKNGGIYPYSEQASTILNALINEISFLDINVLSGITVKDIIKNDDGLFELNILDSRYPDKPKTKLNVVFDRVIVCCGGMAAPKTGSDGSGYYLLKKIGHSINPTYPALVGLKCKGDFSIISGVRCRGSVTLIVDGAECDSDIGELQFTDYGISGIPVFQISRNAAIAVSAGKKVDIKVDFMPDMSSDEFKKELIVRNLVLQNRTNGQFLSGFLNNKLSIYLLKEINLSADDALTEENVKLFAEIVKEYMLEVTGTNDFDTAQVTAGGVPISEISTDFESNICPGLFIAGEILDVDGKCGGYNLQWAWTSGYLAGEAAANAET